MGNRFLLSMVFQCSARYCDIRLYDLGYSTKYAKQSKILSSQCSGNFFAEKKNDTRRAPVATKLNELLAGKLLLSRIFLRLTKLYIYRF